MPLSNQSMSFFEPKSKLQSAEPKKTRLLFTKIILRVKQSEDFQIVASLKHGGWNCHASLNIFNTFKTPYVPSVFDLSGSCRNTATAYVSLNVVRTWAPGIGESRGCWIFFPRMSRRSMRKSTFDQFTWMWKYQFVYDPFVKYITVGGKCSVSVQKTKDAQGFLSWKKSSQALWMYIIYMYDKFLSVELVDVFFQSTVDVLLGKFSEVF